MNDSQVTIWGNTTRDPEMRYTNEGIAVLELGVAVNERVRVDGVYVDGDTTFVDVTIWREQAENVASSCPKGTRVVVVGRLKLDTWENEAGEKRSKLKMVADEVGLSLRWAAGQSFKTAKAAAPVTLPGDVTDMLNSPF